MKRLPLQTLSLSFLLLVCGSTASAQEQNVKVYRWNHSNNFNFSDHSNNYRNPCKVFIGVGTSVVSEGMKVDYTVDDTPATASGVQPGDIIVALDGAPVRSHSSLTSERDKHQQGEAFTLTILRNGSEMQINARFKECSEEEVAKWRERQESHEMRMEEMEERMAEMHARMAEKFEKFEKLEQFGQLGTQERPILGVYEDNNVSRPGLVIGTVIAGKGAEAAGLQSGDVVTSVDGKSVTGGGTLRTALSNKKPGDRVTVVYLRDGQTLQTEVTLSADRSYYSFKTERDPCKVFIGVYTTDHAEEGRGVRVTGVIDDTPAKQSGVQPGDVIVALDGQPVSTHIELLNERNRHKPGEDFTLSVLRDGVPMEIDATFKVCSTTVPTEEKVELLTEERKDEPTDINNALQIEVFEAYPSPTFGPLNVRFEAEAVPTIVRITDLSGRTVYVNTLNQFGGYFSERINLYGNAPGTYVLSVQQGEKISSKKIVLVPGA
jgi:S1-C subfamily serine protease